MSQSINHLSQFDVEEDIDTVFTSDTSSRGLPRWKRKQLEKEQLESLSSSSTTSSSSSSLSSSPLKSNTSLNMTAKSVATPNKSMRSTRGTKTPKGKTPRKVSGTPHMDRFIPNRSAIDLEISHFNLTNTDNVPVQTSTHGQEQEVLLSPKKESYTRTLAENLFSESSSSSKILAFKSKAPAPKEGYQNSLKVLYSQNKSEGRSRKSFRHVPLTSERVLDAPDLVDDFYLNVLDWNKDNILAVALGQTVYLWNPTDGTIESLCEMEESNNYVTSLRWIQEGNYLAVGTNDSQVQLYDCDRMKQVRSMSGHMARVSSLAWNEHILSSGSRDSMIFHHDVRESQHHVATLEGHTQEVCGLQWSADGTHLASGGNDNLLNVWDCRSSTPKWQMTDHQAAVKALAWCPFQSNLLATGGGTADRTIKFWNVSTGACLNTIDTGSQVCALQWSRTRKEIVSAHGYSNNQLCVWNYPSMTKIAEPMGHTSRVLHMAMSPDGSTVCTAAGDETLRFWKVFDYQETRESNSTMAKSFKLPSSSSNSKLMTNMIR
eukprot:TRINITY_DN2382_c0_g1_i1.p1 TRINITY_DN2382_c0_g1~~TRINITY_DN2382_c0_g1_i1.p1  ORF type:complete len:571 (+),score=138.23 TRINITY_DN2382_c0_g1_i1:80-1714(+)